MCGRVITKSEFLEISVVRNPVQKYSVALGQPYNYGAIHYVINGLASPWHAWEYQRSKVETGDSLYAGISRNDPCPCGSGMKFKRCCIDKTKTRDHFEIYFSAPPPSTLPRFLEDARHVVIDEGNSASIEAREK